MAIPRSADLSSILIAIGSLAGNVSFSASSSSSSRCAIAAGRDFCVFFGVSMTLGAFFAFLVIACLHQQPKGGAHVRVERGPNRAFVNEIAHIKQGRAWPLLGRSGDGEKVVTTCEQGGHRFGCERSARECSPLPGLSLDDSLWLGR